MEKDYAHIRQMLVSHLGRRRITRAQFASEIGYSNSSLDKFLAGGTPSTKLETSILRAVAPTATSYNFEVSPYGKDEVLHLVGAYQTLRPSFRSKGAINAFCTEVQWCNISNCLTFQEHGNIMSPGNKGIVSVPRQSGFIYFLACQEGRFRLGILSDAYEKGVLYGGLFTLASERMVEKVPTATSIVLQMRPSISECVAGLVAEDHSRFKEFEKKLQFAKDERFFQTKD